MCRSNWLQHGMFLNRTIDAESTKPAVGAPPRTAAVRNQYRNSSQPVASARVARNRSKAAQSYLSFQFAIGLHDAGTKYDVRATCDGTVSNRLPLTISDDDLSVFHQNDAAKHPPASLRAE